MTFRFIRKYLPWMSGFPLFLLILSCSSGGESSPSSLPSPGGGGAPGIPNPPPPPSELFRVTISLSGSGSGSVISSPPGINCASVCSWNFSSGTLVTLTPSAAFNSFFIGWGGDCSGSVANSCTLNVDSNKSVTVSFALIKMQNISAITAGDAHTCILFFQSAASCWGDNIHGQLGDGTNTSSFSPVLVSVNLGTSVQTLSGGGNHTCWLLSWSQVDCWGDNSSGQLGNDSATDSNVPVLAGGLLYPVGVTAGGNHTCALINGGAVQCWGLNRSGQLGNNSNIDSLVPVSVSGIPLSSSVSAIAVSAGSSHTCALMSDGTVECWGLNRYGQLGNNSTIDSPLPVVVFGMTAASSVTATAISAGGSHTCALMSDGTVECWGLNRYGQLGNNSTIDSPLPVVVHGMTAASSVTATAISAGGSHTCALMSDKTVKCWGSNGFGQLGNGTFTDSPIPGGVSGMASGSLIAAGKNHTCGVLSNSFGNTVVCWGDNQYGQLGFANTNSTATSYSLPHLVSGF